jgi:hypothetical protein
MTAAITGNADFYASVPVFEGFGRIMEPGLYRPLPDDWVLGLSDVVGSTQAIEDGRYKAVNMAGAAVIAAVQNALGRRELPFVFGGDGASLAVAPADAETTRAALAATATWVKEEIGLELRVAMVPVAAARKAGRDVRVARFAASPDVAYAMFSGGGLAWAEQEMKRGTFGVPPAAPGSRPDLSGLSCRWERIPAAAGTLLSLIVVPESGDGATAFRELVAEVLALASASPAAGRPLPEASPGMRWPASGTVLEAKAAAPPGAARWWARLKTSALTLLGVAVFRWGIRIGGFDPARYWRELVANADFRKYDDGLRLTLDCTPELANRIETRLAAAQAAGVARYGVHRQEAALMTCFVPSLQQSNHVHFIDGAAGGYAKAAQRLKAS